MSYEQLIITLLLRGALVLIAAMIMTGLILRRVRASASRWTWTSVFVVLFILPVSLQWKPLELLIESKERTVAAVDSKEEVEPVKGSLSETVPSSDLIPEPLVSLDAPVVAAVETPETSAPTLHPITKHNAVQAAQIAPESRSSWWVIAWAAGAGLVLFYILCGHFFLWRLVRGGRAADEPWKRDCHSIAKELDLAHTPHVLVVDRIKVPTTAGILRPRILIPPAALKYTAKSRRATLLHELTHVRGRDPLCILLAQLVLAAHWCNPLVWIGLRSLRLAQERQCDDAAIAAAEGSASDYADLLLRVASGGRNHFPASAGLALSMAQRSSLGKRIRLILDKSMKRETLTLKHKLALGSAVTILAVPLALTGIGFTSAHANPPEAGADLPSEEVAVETAEPRIVAAEEAETPSQSYLEMILSNAKIPEVDFQEASIEEATTYLRMKTKEMFPDQDEINLVILKSAKGADPYSGKTGLQKRKDNHRLRIEALKKKMRELETKNGVVEGQAAVQRRADALASLESSRIKLETLQEMSAVEIATVFPEAGFVRSAVEKQMKLDEGEPTDSARKRAAEMVERRRQEYLEAVSKSYQVQQNAFERASAEIAAMRVQERSYTEVEAEYKSALEGMKTLNNLESEATAAPGLITLQLKNISLGAALKYSAQQAGVEMSIQPEAVIFGSSEEIAILEGKKATSPERKAAAPPKIEDLFDPAAAPAGRRKEEPSDTYLRGYLAVQEAENLKKAGKPIAALGKYKEALSTFRSLSESHPNFESDMVSFRIKKTEEGIKASSPYTESKKSKD